MEINDNIRAELARSRKSVTLVLDALDISSATWYRRMADPRGWTIGQIDDLARFLNISRERLTDTRK